MLLPALRLVLLAVLPVLLLVQGLRAPEPVAPLALLPALLLL